MEDVESTADLAAAAAAAKKKIFLCMNCILIAMGSLGGPLLMRLYFIRGGNRIWFASWLQTGGCPIMLIPLLVCYTRRREKLLLMNSRVFSAATAIGVLAGVDGYLYSYGVAKLPVSTSSLIIATQLAFTAAFAFLLVNQRFTAYSINAVVLLTVAAAVLGLHTSGDRPQGESDRMYWLGFAMTAAAAALYGLILPLLELTYKKANQAVTYNLVMEIQLVMSLSATAFCTVGMLINHDFQAIQREAKEFELGEKKYYLVVVGCAIIWQCVFLGINGVVFYASSLFSGILITLCLPITEVLAVIFYRENFHAEKGLSLFLSLWGFISYFWGDFKTSKKLHNGYNSNTDQRPQVVQSAIQTPPP